MTTAPIDEITATVTGIVANELGVEAAGLDPQTDLRAVEGMDSLKVLRMIARIEKIYDIELEDDVIFSVERIDELAAAIAQAQTESV